MALRRAHDCVRCGRTIEPGDRFSAVDVLDPEGELKVLLCRGCGADLRAFLDGDD